MPLFYGHKGPVIHTHVSFLMAIQTCQSDTSQNWQLMLWQTHIPGENLYPKWHWVAPFAINQLPKMQQQFAPPMCFNTIARVAWKIHRADLGREY